MTFNAPGKHERQGLSLLQVTSMFPDDASSEAWFVKTRWSDGIACPHCGSTGVYERPSRKPLPYRCRDCKKYFSVKTGTPMQGSNLGFRIWAIAFYLMATGIKGTASMKLHRDLGITQKTAWHLAHRIRESWTNANRQFTGPVEVDETYIGGKRKNMPKHKRESMTGRGSVGKVAIAGAKDRASNQVNARVVHTADAETLQEFVAENANPGATVYTDDHSSYETLPFHHESVKHSIGEYVRGQAHTNGIESFWSLLKRGYYGTFHTISPEHLNRYVSEFAGRHNVRPMDTVDQMAWMVRKMDGKVLRYKDLVGVA